MTEVVSEWCEMGGEIYITDQTHYVHTVCLPALEDSLPQHIPT